ncbi:MAG: ROK family protein [Oscillospiraceae bacterium]|nr:ROK family protein [Oscillospiraceae bacterium]
MRLGVDIGGANIVAGVVDSGNAILARGSVRSRIGLTADEFCADVKSAIDIAVEAAGVSLSDVSFCGIGCPGSVRSDTGMWTLSFNLGIVDLPLADKMTALLGLPVGVENDANCAALGEVKCGAAQGAESALCITLGTGVGGGIIIGGKIWSGAGGLAGEVGHMSIYPGGEECSCGRRGCWEAYCSAPALKRQIRRAMEISPESELWRICGSPDKVHGRSAFEAMRLGDPAATLIVETYIYNLAEGLANCIQLLRPEIICIGGGVSNEGDDLIIPLRQEVDRRCFGGEKAQTTTVVCAKLQNDAGIIGAALLNE